VAVVRGGAVGVGVVALLVLAGGGWFYAGEIRRGALEAAPPAAPAYALDVLELADGAVSLSRQADAPRELTAEGVYGLHWDDGYGQVGAIVEVGPDRVVRDFTPLTGEPLAVGDRVAVDAFAFPCDPRTAYGLPFQEVTYPSELGDTPAWFVPGERTTWVLFVHGYNAPRREALRLLRPVAEQGFPALVLDYRNDAGAPRTDDGLRRYGQSEWRDVEAATAYALEHGASDVVLVGYSMGGAIVTSFLYESDLAERVRGAVLDAPALDLGAVIDHAARDRRLPGLGLPLPAALTQVAKGMTGVRDDLDWGALDYLDRAGELSTPILLFHGTADSTVPVALSEALAAARPDLVTFVPVRDAEHVQSWNADPARYERETLTFLERVASPSP
jgi:pimeloyl-ACP methyl ester carboxylesterase